MILNQRVGEKCSKENSNLIPSFYIILITIYAINIHRHQYFLYCCYYLAHLFNHATDLLGALKWNPSLLLDNEGN